MNLLYTWNEEKNFHEMILTFNGIISSKSINSEQSSLQAKSLLRRWRSAVRHS